MFVPFVPSFNAVSDGTSDAATGIGGGAFVRRAVAAALLAIIYNFFVICIV